MQIRAELCHVDTLRCVVRVEARQGERLLGSSLGEGQTSEDAEDRALERLMRRLGTGSEPTDARPFSLSSESQNTLKDGSTMPAAPVPGQPRSDHQTASSRTTANDPVKPDQTMMGQPSGEQQEEAANQAHSTNQPKTHGQLKTADQPKTTGQSKTSNQSKTADQPKTSGQPKTADQPKPSSSSELPSETPTDPEDWSEELSSIDLEVQRIGWDRTMERVYLERAFGHGSRHRLTRYADLLAYLRQLRTLQPDDHPETASVPIRRADLIQQGDEMLRQLNWTSDQARAFLQTSMGAQSRQQLSDEQLLQFNLSLEDKIEQDV